LKDEVAIKATAAYEVQFFMAFSCLVVASGRNFSLEQFWTGRRRTKSGELPNLSDTITHFTPMHHATARLRCAEE
jgi:hypothetical protein